MCTQTYGCTSTYMHVCIMLILQICMYRYAYLCVCVYPFIFVETLISCAHDIVSFILSVLDAGMYGMIFLGTESVLKSIWIYICMVLYVYTKHADIGWA